MSTDAADSRRRDGGWALTVVRHGGTCGAELGTVFQNASGLLLIGFGIIGSRRLDESNQEPVRMLCPKCGREAEGDPKMLRRRALQHPRSITIA
jgi:hypothetical protein